MTSFTTRILLQGNPPEAEYERLHVAMTQKNFSRTIESNEGIQYKLPHAEYNISGIYTKSQVLDFAKAAVRASVSNRVAQILVTESAGRTWSNLELI